MSKLTTQFSQLAFITGESSPAARPSPRRWRSTAARCSPRPSPARAGYDGAKRRRGSKVHVAVDTLGHLMALTVTPADESDRAQVAALAEQLQEVTGSLVELAYVDRVILARPSPKPPGSMASGLKWSGTPWLIGPGISEPG